MMRRILPVTEGILRLPGALFRVIAVFFAVRHFGLPDEAMIARKHRNAESRWLVGNAPLRA